MGYYHVVVQSCYGKDVFTEEEDCLIYLGMVRDAFQKYKINWLAYAVMPTHVHLLVEIGENALATLQKARRKITFAFNTYARKQKPKLLGKENKIFHPNVTIKMPQTLHDVQQVIRYIHLNPLRKGLETTLGASIRTSYSIVLALWEPQNTENPFNHFFDLQDIRDAIAIETVERAFGKNRNEQKRNFLSFHAQPVPEAVPEDPTELLQIRVKKKEALEKAERILITYFMKYYSFERRTYNEDSRDSFLRWLNRKGNPHKTELILLLRKNTSLTAHEIAVLLHMGDTTVKKIVAEHKE